MVSSTNVSTNSRELFAKLRMQKRFYLSSSWLMNQSFDVWMSLLCQGRKQVLPGGAFRLATACRPEILKLPTGDEGDDVRVELLSWGIRKNVSWDGGRVNRNDICMRGGESPFKLLKAYPHVWWPERKEWGVRDARSDYLLVSLRFTGNVQKPPAR